MTTRRGIISAGFAGFLILANLSLAPAQDVAARSTAGPAVLTISGPGGGASHDLTMADLEKLPKAEIRTTTPWHNGVQHFEGVSLQVLMESLKLSGANAQVTALNRYRTTIPMKDFSAFKPILAYRRNGAPMEVREKGPLFIIYPYDSNTALKHDTYFSRSAWQVRSITVE
ncbi:MAG: oxidoreductase [Beijerinckiaceae bacterium]|nr:oxidoreductase [Beijerinckiaceae bacterium]